MLNQLSLAGNNLTALLDKFNDRFTSYRLMLYFLLALLGWAIIGSFFNQVPYSAPEIIVSAVFLLAVCWVLNKLISRFLDIPANKESALITALILTLILAAPKTGHDYAALAAAGLTAIASKYLLTLYKSHVFNPAAAGAFIAGEVFHNYPAWWVGTRFMTPVVIIGGILILRKMKRYIMALIFLAVYVLYLIFVTSGGNLHFVWTALISTQTIFFAVVMLIEPLTSPTNWERYLPYTLLVGVLYSVTKLKISPESALLIGNLFTLLIATNRRYELKFIERSRQADGIYSYAFGVPAGFGYKPGQYMEWTVAHNRSDSRGNRRYFTISSAPTERQLAFTVKHPPNASSFKRGIDVLKPGDKILAAHLAGSFTLPEDKAKKLAFLAGGVGITPFRSMVKYLVDKNEQRDVALIYSANSADEISFKNLFDKAEAVGVKANYVTNGPIDESKIRRLAPDFAQRVFYVSGPYGFVNAMEQSLLKMGVRPARIITDYFPGYGG